jgi:hypothetical protein
MSQEKFHTYFTQFIDELSEQFPTEPSLQLAKAFIKDTDSSELMNKYKMFVLPHRDLVESENEDFFKKSDWFYNMTSPAKVFSIKDIWESDKLDNEDKTMVWQWFKLFNKIATC